jgi:transketolase
MVDYKGPSVELECVNTIRAVSADQPESANSGHPGAPMGCAPMAFLLWAEVMKYSGKSPKWIARDRFVLSNGHACALQYTMLHLAGYDLTAQDLSQFRKLGSKTPGHPESFVTDGIEVCTGPLGQGICNAVGLAMAETHLAATYNTSDYKLFDNYTYVICGDGCLQEGISGEASSLAGHLGLGKLMVFYDDNSITIDGETSLSFTEDVQKRYEAYGWHVQQVDDVVSQLDDLRAAVQNAKQVTDKPSMIVCKTIIGYGSPNKANSHNVHGAPLGAAELSATKEFYGLPKDENFYVSETVKQVFAKAIAKNEAELEQWQAMMAKYQAEFPDKAQEIQRRMAGQLPEGWDTDLPKFTIGQDKDLATRKFSEQCINAFAPRIPEMVGGSADLTPSNLTRFKNAVDYQKDSPEGRYIRFGVREHGMAAICNGMFAYGGMRPYCATFLTFMGYMIGAVRLSALSQFGILYVMTHDSIGLGEDGPTHQPIETLENLRSMPNINVYRPADSNEMAAAYKVAMESSKTPTVICCSRSTVPALFGSSIENGAKGGYVAVHVENAALILISSGSEVGFCVDAARALTDAGTPTRVVSMPCQEIFLAQSEEHQKSVLPGDIPTLSVEAAAVHGWHRFSHAQIGMTSFGASGSGDALFKHFGFTPANIQAKGLALVDFYKANGPVPNLTNRPVFDNIEGKLH